MWLSRPNRVATDSSAAFYLYTVARCTVRTQGSSAKFRRHSPDETSVPDVTGAPWGGWGTGEGGRGQGWRVRVGWGRGSASPAAGLARRRMGLSDDGPRRRRRWLPRLSDGDVSGPGRGVAERGSRRRVGGPAGRFGHVGVGQRFSRCVNEWSKALRQTKHLRATYVEMDAKDERKQRNHLHVERVEDRSQAQIQKT
jgi:hypothetical protein